MTHFRHLHQSLRGLGTASRAAQAAGMCLPAAAVAMLLQLMQMCCRPALARGNRRRRPHWVDTVHLAVAAGRGSCGL